jgi:hypothetical protein
MNGPKLHHYVPQFYLRRFVGRDGNLWVWDKTKDRAFASSPGSVAAETQFYRLHDFDLGGHPKPASRGHLKTGQLKP